MSLSIRDLHVGYGGRDVIDGVSFEVPAGAVVGLVGPNGAGKTSLLDAVSGFVPYRGQVLLGDAPIDALSADARARAGLRRTWQALELFEDLTVAENLRVGAAQVRDTGSAPPGGDPYALGRGAGLESDIRQMPGSLPHGRRGLVGIARALAGRPSVLLLDEPAAGLDPAEREALAGRLRQLAAAGVAILLIDHDLSLVLGVCDTVCVLDGGRLIAAAPPEQVRADPAVRAAYLGSDQPQPGGRREQREPGQQAGEPGQQAGEQVLQVKGVSAGYAGVPVLHEVELAVGRGEVVALLGPNGAGKTTLLRTICRLVPLTGGSVLIQGRPPARRPETNARRGLALVPAGRGLFGSLTVRENMLLAGRSGHDEVLDLLPGLRPLLARRASLLSGGEAQQLSLARALLRKPTLLLVDEPSTGLAPTVVQDLLSTLRTLADERGMAVLLVEQAVAQALAVADRAAVLDRGRIVLEGSADELASRPHLVESAYLGAPAAGGH